MILMSYWLFKTEPEDYGWFEFVKEGRTVWDGVKAGKALKNMSKMLPGEKAFFYHTGNERSIVGTSEVVSKPYSNPLESNPKLLVVELIPLTKMNKPVSLKMLKELAEKEKDNDTVIWKDWDLLRLPRLSVIEVTETQWKEVLKLSQ